MQDVQLVLWAVSIIVTPAMFIWAALIGLWILGAPPFHKSPVSETAIPIAVCPNCGYRSKEFLAFVQKIQLEEHGEE